MSEHLLEIKNLKKTFPLRNGGWFGKKERMCAVDNLSLTIEKGETYGLVGESGCGKSTTGRMIVGLTKADSGSIPSAICPSPMTALCPSMSSSWRKYGEQAKAAGNLLISRRLIVQKTIPIR